MTANKNEIRQEAIERMYIRFDKFADRLDNLEGEMTGISKLLEKIEARNERLEQIYAEIMQSIGKMQAEIELNKQLTDRLQRSVETEANENKGTKEIILQLLENARAETEKFAELIDAEKNRKQERFLKIWAAVGPIIASVLTSVFSKFLL